MPFEDFLEQLRLHGLEINQATHIGVRAVLNCLSTGNSSVEKTRYQLGALVARSEEELQQFYTLFDQYLEFHTYTPPKQDEFEGETSLKTNLKFYSGILIGFIISTLGYLGLTYYQGILNASYTFELSGFRAIPPPNVRTNDLEQQFSVELLFESDIWWVNPPKNVDSITVLYGDGREECLVFQKSSDSFSTKEDIYSSTDNQVYQSYKNGTRQERIIIPLSHKYPKPGHYQALLFVHFQDSVYYIKESEFQVGKWLEVDFSFTREGDTWNFSNNSFIYSPKYDSSENELKIPTPVYEWSFGDGNISSEIHPEHTYKDPGTYSVTLTVTGTWQDTTITKQVTKEISAEPIPTLRKIGLVDEDISDLLKTYSNPLKWLPWALLSTLIVYWLLEGLIFFFRKVAIDQKPQLIPPLNQRLRFHGQNLPYFRTQDFFDLAKLYRKRTRTKGVKNPNVSSSIRKTIEAGGFLNIDWKDYSRASQYLVLIEKHSTNDILARLIEKIFQEFGQRDISTQIYFYFKEPSICWRNRESESISINKLANLYPDYRLVIIGEGEALLKQNGKELDTWTDIFDIWKQKAWVSTIATQEWGLTEEILSRKFVFVPAIKEGFESVVTQWQNEDFIAISWWKKYFFEISVPDPGYPHLIPELFIYLGKRGLEWLAGCAWYPELNWELTLQIGQLFERSDIQRAEKNTADLNYLLHYLKLPWFRQGKIPRNLRVELAHTLPESKAKIVRDFILNLLLQDRNHVPKNSFAHSTRQIQIAVLTYLNSHKDRAARKRLKKEIQSIDPDDLQDSLILNEVKNIKPSVLSVILPARFFKGQIPLLGVKQRIRTICISLLILSLLGISSYLTFPKPDQPYDPSKAYDFKELTLSSSNDSSRFWVHEGFRRYQLDTLAEVDVLFQRALSTDSSFEKAIFNYSINSYNKSIDFYESDQLDFAVNILSPVVQRLSQVDPDRRSTIPQIWLPYSLGISYLRIGQNKELLGLSAIQKALCNPITDLTYQQAIRDSLLKIFELQRLISLRYSGFQDTDTAMVSFSHTDFHQCIGSYIDLPIFFQDSSIIDTISLNLPVPDTVGNDSSGSTLPTFPSDSTALDSTSPNVDLLDSLASNSIRIDSPISSTGSQVFDFEGSIGDSMAISSSTDSLNPNGDDYILLIGINQYDNWPNLNNSVKDCQDLAGVLTTYYQFKPENVIRIFNRQATRENIIETFESLQDILTPNDNLLIYFSGHGYYDEGSHLGYWVPFEARQEKIVDYIVNSTIHDYLKTIKALHILLIVDAPYGGSIFATRSEITDENKKSRWAFTSGNIENVWDGEPGQNSPFAAFLINTLQQNIKPEFRTNDLIRQVSLKVSRNTRQTPIGSPLALDGDDGGIFIFRRKGSP